MYACMYSGVCTGICVYVSCMYLNYCRYKVATCYHILSMAVPKNDECIRKV